ncbi:MAG: hypothetical protein ACYDAL_11420 [Candidatus Dormibacteraceae bacterium]
MNWKRKFAILSVPAVLALGGGALAVQAAQTPPLSPASTILSGARTVATETGETPDATETIEAPGAPEVGHADSAANATADNQFEGNE